VIHPICLTTQVTVKAIGSIGRIWNRVEVYSQTKIPEEVKPTPACTLIVSC
jgi:hypothetical protein